MNSTKLSIQSIFALVAIGLAFLPSSASAQAQSLLSSNQVVITRVEPVMPDGLLITGINFNAKSNGTPVVSLSLPARGLVVLNSRYTTGSQEIIATLPVGTTATAPGTYRLMVSFGPGTAATDVFEFTIGAVGLTGAQGIQGIQGIKA